MIVRNRAGALVPIASRAASFGAYLGREGYGRAGVGTNVTETGVRGLPAATAAIRIVSSQMMMSQVGVFRGRNLDRRPVENGWQAAFFAGSPSIAEPWEFLLEQTEASLTGRWNAFWLKVPNELGQVEEVHVLAADRMEARWNEDTATPEYRVRGTNGSVSDWLTQEFILHFRVGFCQPGEIIAPSPITVHKEVLRAALSRGAFESSLYENGVLSAIAVKLPKEIDPEQAERFRMVFQAEHGGSANAGKVKVLGGGAEVETIGLSLEDAQFIETMQYDVERLANIFGIPSSLLGAGRDGGRPVSPEHEQRRLEDYWMGPRRRRIAAWIRQDQTFFGPRSRTYPDIVANGVRGDVRTEADRLAKLVQTGILLQDEARAELGLGPLPGGVGQIPQTTPVGGAPTETDPAPSDGDPSLDPEQETDA